MSRIDIAEVRAFQQALQQANTTMRARIQAVQASALRYSGDYFLDGQAIQASQQYFRETYQTVGGSLLDILDTSEALLERYLNDFSAQVDDSRNARVDAELLGIAAEKARSIRRKQEDLKRSLTAQTGASQEGRVQQLRLDLVNAVEEEKILENYLQFEQSHTHFFQELLGLVMTTQRTMRQLLQDVQFNAQTGSYTYPKGYTQSIEGLKKRLDAIRGVDPKLEKALKAYQVLAVVYYDAHGKPQVMWLLEQNGVGVSDPKLKKYLEKTGKYLDPSDYQIITNEDLNQKINQAWKKGTYYMDGTKYSGMVGGTLRASAYVESVKGTLDESGLMDVVMGLGLSTAAIRGSMTYGKVGGTKNVDDISWSLNKNGATINGRKYSGHALERMAPDTLEIRARLHTRAYEIAKGKEYVPGTREYSDFIKKYVQPRNVPPSVIEDAIKNGVKTTGNQINTWKFETGDVTVIINDLGNVITVIPK